MASIALYTDVRFEVSSISPALPRYFVTRSDKILLKFPKLCPQNSYDTRCEIITLGSVDHQADLQGRSLGRGGVPQVIQPYSRRAIPARPGSTSNLALLVSGISTDVTLVNENNSVVHRSGLTVQMP
jgi:hypothetical protein